MSNKMTKAQGELLIDAARPSTQIHRQGTIRQHGLQDRTRQALEGLGYISNQLTYNEVERAEYEREREMSSSSRRLRS
jgi:hypothetical protein